MWILISFGLILSTLFDISAFSINTENQQVRPPTLNKQDIFFLVKANKVYQTTKITYIHDFCSSWIAGTTVVS